MKSNDKENRSALRGDFEKWHQSSHSIYIINQSQSTLYIHSDISKNLSLLVNYVIIVTRYVNYYYYFFYFFSSVNFCFEKIMIKDKRKDKTVEQVLTSWQAKHTQPYLVHLLSHHMDKCEPGMSTLVSFGDLLGIYTGDVSTTERLRHGFTPSSARRQSPLGAWQQRSSALRASHIHARSRDNPKHTWDRKTPR